MAISSALMSEQDQRLQVVADIYFREALSGAFSGDQFVRPTNKSLQMMLLLCIYTWICPASMDIWRLLGHASRMCLDIIEMHGSDKTDAANAVVLYRTLYALETQISISFGRPHHLPDGKDVPAYSPDSSLMAAGELSTMVYDLSRLQNRFHKDVIGRDYIAPAMVGISWMSGCVHDMKAWLEDWRSRVETLFASSPTSQGGTDMELPFKLWGEFQHCEALLLAKVAMDRRSHDIISDEDELGLCKQLLRAAAGLRQTPDPEGRFVSARARTFTFPLTWTRTHAIFTATVTLLQHMHTRSLHDVEMQVLLRAGLDMLDSANRTGDYATAGLVDCIQKLYKFSCQPTSI
ncbi:hypothetical protein GQ53DRAFT_754059 [Thozetella sp. PMI_491]|nr:hypothetical protein GQ53DRAFT_754059 [Thozetella sp. PMI_491]